MPLPPPPSLEAGMTGAYGTAGYVAGFGNFEAPDGSLDEQRARLQQRAGKFDQPGEDDDVGEMDWTVTYIDMVTLLMIFFVVLSFMSMISSNNRINTETADIPEASISTSVSDIIPAGAYSPFDGHGFTPADGGMPANRDNIRSRYNDPDAEDGTTDPAPSGTAHTAQDNPPDQTPQPQQPPPDPRAEQLAQQLQQMVQQSDLAGQVEVISGAGSVTVRISEKILFPSGRATLEQGGQDLVARLSKVLAESGGTISIEGHTDNVPISTALYPSNWELSAARATTVLRQLGSLGLPADRLRAIAYADTKPVAVNDTVDHRAQNRRVELVISSRPPPTVAPPPAAAP